MRRREDAIPLIDIQLRMKSSPNLIILFNALVDVGDIVHVEVKFRDYSKRHEPGRGDRSSTFDKIKKVFLRTAGTIGQR